MEIGKKYHIEILYLIYQIAFIVKYVHFMSTVFYSKGALIEGYNGDVTI